MPIGLAVFGGLSLITLIAVGIVTYERKKYRRQFRERKRIQVLGTRSYGGFGDGGGGGTGFDGTGLGVPGQVGGSGGGEGYGGGNVVLGGVAEGGVRMTEARI